MAACPCTQNSERLIYRFRAKELRVPQWSDSGHGEVQLCVLCGREYRPTYGGADKWKAIQGPREVADEVAAAYRLHGLPGVSQLKNLEQELMVRLAEAHYQIRQTISLT